MIENGIISQFILKQQHIETFEGAFASISEIASKSLFLGAALID